MVNPGRPRKLHSPEKQKNGRPTTKYVAAKKAENKRSEAEARATFFSGHRDRTGVKQVPVASSAVASGASDAASVSEVDHSAFTGVIPTSVLDAAPVFPPPMSPEQARHCIFRVDAERGVYLGPDEGQSASGSRKRPFVQVSSGPAEEIPDDGWIDGVRQRFIVHAEERRQAEADKKGAAT
ncbi:hypothetical protein BGZ65_009483, partial [Modicella reniformis]